MKRTTRAVTTVGLALGLALGGAGVAQASLSWGTLSVYDSGLQGQGYGKAYASAPSTASLSSHLRDVHHGHGRTYVELLGYWKVPQFLIQTGRRADGESNFAAMAVASGHTQVPVAGYRAAVTVCQDIPIETDPCSSTTYGWF